MGLSNPDQAVLVAEGVGTAFLARRKGRTVEGYDWGGLTSSSRLQPLWVLLLPFTLLNVAGWMHPPSSRSSAARLKLIRGTVHFLAASLTASWVIYLSVLLIDVAGYQWSRRWASVEAVSGFPLVRLTAASGIHPIQYAAMAFGFVLVAAISIGIWRIAGNTQKAFEGRTPYDVPRERDRDSKGWSSDEDLSSAFFFSHEVAARRLLRAHSAIAILAFIAVLARTGFMVPRHTETLQMGRLLLLLGGLQFLGVAGLALASLETYRHPGERRLAMAPAVIAGLGFALTNAFFSGLLLLAVQRLSAWPKVSASDDVPVRGGPELLLTDVWFVLVILGVIMAVVSILRHRRAASYEGIGKRTSPPGTPLDGPDATWRQSIRSARGLATAAKNAPELLRSIVTVFFFVALAFSLLRLDPNDSLNPLRWDFSLVSLDRNGTWAVWDWEITPVTDRKVGILWQGGAWLLTLLPVFAAGLVYRATRSTTARRTVGILWDVFTFWPRRFQPFGVRPYSERAVVELKGRISVLVAKGPLVISAHSQGSILAFAALASCDREETSEIALVTYGSPIRTIYANVFPAYFGTEAVQKLSSKLLDGVDFHRWGNFYRDTDPIGGPVFEQADPRLPDSRTGTAAPSDDASTDFKIDDPAVAPGADDIPEDDPGIETPRVAWTNVAGHSHYLREVELQRWVNEVKERMSERSRWSTPVGG